MAAEVIERATLSAHLEHPLLRCGLALAGARAVVSTLWKIPDDETADLSATFWAELAGGKKPTDALAIAQRKMLTAGGRTAHPYYWAAFNVTVR